jgi:hypothetical protein
MLITVNTGCKKSCCFVRSVAKRVKRGKGYVLTAVQNIGAKLIKNTIPVASAEIGV